MEIAKNVLKSEFFMKDIFHQLEIFQENASEASIYKECSLFNCPFLQFPGNDRALDL